MTNQEHDRRLCLVSHRPGRRCTKQTAKLHTATLRAIQNRKLDNFGIVENSFTFFTTNSGLTQQRLLTVSRPFGMNSTDRGKPLRPSAGMAEFLGFFQGAGNTSNRTRKLLQNSRTDETSTRRSGQWLMKRKNRRTISRVL